MRTPKPRCLTKISTRLQRERGAALRSWRPLSKGWRIRRDALSVALFLLTKCRGISILVAIIILRLSSV